MVTRRDITIGGVVLGALAAAGVGTLTWRGRRANAAAEIYEVTHTPDEWRKLLTPEQYAVLREADTERPFTSPLNHEKRKGVFACAGCDLPLFASETKFDSGTGWPSFYAPIKREAVTVKEDRSMAMVRTEVLCANCEAHLGHLFPDGPRPTGLRFCMNSASLKLEPRPDAKK